MAQNKIISMIDMIRHAYRVNKHRRLTLLINYLSGLEVEYIRQDETYLDTRFKQLEAYYQEEVEVATKRLGGYTKDLEKKEKAIASYDKKAYWQRRAYQTKLSRTSHGMIPQELLNTYDQKQAQKRHEYLASLDAKYPNVLLDSNEKALYTKHIEERKNVLVHRQERAQTIYHQKHIRWIKSIDKNKIRILKLTEANEKLSTYIEDFHNEEVKRDERLIFNLRAALKELEDHSGSQKRHHKKHQKLKDQIDLIETTKQVIEQPSIHLSVSKLKMFFGGVKAVNDLSFQVKKGEIFGLIGPNGAGKTTVFNCLTQFYKATAGSMVFRNKEGNVVNLYQRKTHDMIHEGIARSFQNVELIWELTVLDNLLVAAHSLLVTNYFEHMIHSRRMMREEKVLRTKGMSILKNLGIEEYAYRSPYGLPYGILKKVELARTLMTDPSLIILDEPAAGLNDAETQELARIIQKINHEYGITIFLVEHDMGLVMSICDTVCAISFGKMIGIGTPYEIQQNPDVRKAYLGDDSDE
ncbi:MAG: ABC transporter ATP-binding protein [Acholeplasmataceae bacterium]|jgi:ABC-type branched-subunit amino acid transport system ATPase component|nr:ABC transporter ATP-binding protein [Acholeplasmataceae bacterium]